MMKDSTPAMSARAAQRGGCSSVGTPARRSPSWAITPARARLAQAAPSLRQRTASTVASTTYAPAVHRPAAASGALPAVEIASAITPDTTRGRAQGWAQARPTSQGRRGAGAVVACPRLPMACASHKSSQVGGTRVTMASAKDSVGTTA